VDNLFLFVEVVLEARATDVFVAWSCKMEWQSTSGEQCQPRGETLHTSLHQN